MARRVRSSKGANMIEAAIITPLLLLVTFAVVDFGMVFYVWLTLNNGVSQATRFAVTGQTIGGGSREESIKTAMRNATPTLTLPDSAFTFTHMAPGGNAWVAGVGAQNDIGRVTVSYNWSLYTPLVSVFFPNGEIRIRAESAMKNERFQ